MQFNLGLLDLRLAGVDRRLEAAIEPLTTRAA
jgi:hypothetical protein